MPDISEDDAVAEINALQELTKTEGWKIFTQAMIAERDRNRQSACRAESPDEREQSRHVVNMLEDTVIHWAEERLKALRKIFDKIG